MEELESVLEVFDNKLTSDEIKKIISKNERLKALLDKVLDNIYLKTPRNIRLYATNDVVYNFLICASEVNGVLLSDTNEYNIDKYTTSIKEYFKQMKRLPLLDWEEQKKLFLEYRETKSIEIRNKIFLYNIRIPLDIVLSKFKVEQNLFLDLLQAGNEGLVKAIERFDLDKGCKFSTYAYATVHNYVYKYYVENKDIIRVPTNTSIVVYNIKKKYQNNFPSIPLLAKEYNIGEDTLLYAFGALRSLESLDSKVAGDDDDERDNTIGSMVSDPNVDVSNIAVDSIVSKQINDYLNRNLTEKEAITIKMHYGFIDDTPYTFSEIASFLGVSKQRVDQLDKSAIRKLNNSKFKSLLQG